MAKTVCLSGIKQEQANKQSDVFMPRLLDSKYLRSGLKAKAKATAYDIDEPIAVLIRSTVLDGKAIGGRSIAKIRKRKNQTMKITIMDHKEKDKLVALLKAQISPSELDNCVIYLFSIPVEGGSILDFPGSTINVPWKAHLAFIDLDPLANYGHRCKYVMVNTSTGETKSIGARFPPFRPNIENKWRVAYHSLNVPKKMLAAPLENNLSGDERN